jgi:hypothetical protein
MNKAVFLMLTSLLFTPIVMRPQESSGRAISALKIQPGVPAVEFPSTSNASQLGVPFVTGYQFTVKTPVTLNTLGAVLQSSSMEPVFGSLSAALPVSLWDNAQKLLATATVSGSDPLIGHFSYHAVPEVLLQPGVTYTIAALVPAGYSVLSDVPGIATGSEVVFAAARSVASSTLVFPSEDTLGRNSYFGASFTYLNATPLQGPIPIAPTPVRRPIPIVATPLAAPSVVPDPAPLDAPLAVPMPLPAMNPVADSTSTTAAAPADTPTDAPPVTPEAVPEATPSGSVLAAPANGSKPIPAEKSDPSR